MRTLSCLVLLTGALAGQTAEAPTKQQALWQKLEAEVAETDRSLDGVMGVAITDLTSGQQVLHNADQVFPTASVIKLAVLAELYHQEQQGAAGAAGKARLGDLYTVRKEDLVPDSDVLAGLTPGVSRVTNRDLATFMTSVSDNSAMNVLIDRVGMENVNALLDSLGLKQMRLRRKMMDLDAARQGRENVSTPREMAALLEAVYSGRILGKPLAPNSTAQNSLTQQSLTDDFFKVLSSGRTHYKAYFRAGGIPDEVVVAEKEGELEGVRADCGVVFVPGRPFALCVMTSYLTDERAGEAAISRIAGAAWRYFDRLGRASPYGRIISPRNSGNPK